MPAGNADAPMNDPNEHTQWDSTLQQDGAVFIYGSKIKVLLVVTGCLAVTAVSAWMALRPREYTQGMPTDILGYAGLALFGIIGVAQLVKLFMPRTVVKVDPEGIAINNRYLAWSEIRRVRLYGRQIRLNMTDRAFEERLKYESVWFRICQFAIGAFGLGPGWTLPVTLKSTSAAELGPWLNELHQAYSGS